MKRFLLLLSVFLVTFICKGQEWAPVGDKIKTKWAAEVSPENVWEQYPRPQMNREKWRNLNGLWDYAIRPKGENEPKSFDGKILVPFAVESSLSGVGKQLLPEDELWYKTTFDVSEWKDQNVIIHFGAVDFKSTVYLNDKEVGVHEGGNDPFSYNITNHLKPGKQTLTLKVWDPTDKGIQPRGKQILSPHGFWYTAVSGIWQTVWLEPVGETHISSIYPITDIDNNTVIFKSEIAKAEGNEEIVVGLYFNDELLLEKTSRVTNELSLEVPEPQLWSPDFPNLYDVKIILKRDGEILDQFDSYFGMRKIALGEDSFGRTKLFLNNKELFQFGTLDQGWWPDGLLTPPTEEAMVYDMKVVKDLGFNMIRKHIKVEPARYYYNADKLGLLLWQDMPTGFLNIHHPEQHVKHDSPEDWNRPKESADQFKKEWKSIIDNLRFFQSIVVWVPFNEGWGQFESKEITNWTMDYDPSRLVDGISGWADRNVGHFYDAHQYPGPGMESPSQFPGRAIVLGEFGGLGHPLEGHIWDESRNNWGYRNYVDKDDFLNQYSQAIYNLYPEKARGLAGAIYTQTTDVEAEVNGLMTYDRKVLKLPTFMARVLHKRLYENFENPTEILIKDGEINSQEKEVTYKKPEINWMSYSRSANDFEITAVPAELKKGGSVYSRAEFELNTIPENLALKFYGDGDVTIYINGIEVMSKYLRTKRHYDDLNLSLYTPYLRKGNNLLAIEVKNSQDNTSFDYGLYSF